MNNRAGHYKSNLSGEMTYSSFVPSPLPPTPPVELSNDIINLLVKANSQLVVLEAVASRIPNVALFISMYVRKEALMSSQIEGTQATLEDILDPLLDANANRDVADVVNYIKATEFAIKRLHSLPLCNRLLRETHAVLMEGVRSGVPRTGSAVKAALLRMPDTFLRLPTICRPQCPALKNIFMQTMKQMF